LGYLCSGRQPLLLPLSVVGYINVLMRMVSSLTLRLQASAVEKAPLGHGPDCALGFCLGTRLGKGRGPGYLLLRANFPHISFGKLSGRALAGSNKNRISREGYGRARAYY
jgi:hypothetical protein